MHDDRGDLDALQVTFNGECKVSDIKFKDGDLVYCPMATNEILTVSDKRNVAYEGTDGEISTIGVYYDGKYSRQHHNLAIFPATQEWYEKLVHVYPNLEEPMQVKDIIKHLLDEGNAGVLCWVSDQDEFPNSDNSVAVITRITIDEYFISHDSHVWGHATPIMKIETFDARITVAKTGN
jgi:hypothetical protein